MRRVPSRVNLEAMKREARDLLHTLRQRDAAALRRYHCVDSLAGLSQPSLADAQYVIAHEYGFSSWPKLETFCRLHTMRSPSQRRTATGAS
jgi:hypothetical protein